MTVLTNRLAHPNIGTVILVEATAGERLLLWTQTVGKTYTFEASSSQRIVNVKQDGVSLTAQASIDAVEANAGSWYAAGGRVYVRTTGDVGTDTVTLQAIAAFCYATKARIFNGIYYDPRILSLPSLSLRIERKFGDPGQLGSGAITFVNSDGHFDTLSGLQWDAGSIVLKMGADLPDAQATYAQYDTVGTFLTKSWEKSDDKFTLMFEEWKSRTKKKIPTTFYDRDPTTGYPLMRESDVGKALQIAYGIIYDIAPVCIDLSTNQFKVAGHPIREISAVRVKNEATGAWVDTPYTEVVDAAATFKIPSWDQTAEVAVDFIGKMLEDGITVMDNPADVVKDILLTYLGEDPSSIG